MIGLDELLSRTRISDIVPALGGPEPRRGRCAAWFRGGDNPTALSLDDDKGVYFDNVTGTGGGVLSLIEAATGCDRKGAAAWLASYHGVSLGQASPSEAQQLAERQRIVRQRAAELVGWRDSLILALRDVRNGAWSAARRIDIESTGMDAEAPATWERIAEGFERRRIGDALHSYMLDISKMTGGELADLRARLEQTDARRAA